MVKGCNKNKLFQGNKDARKNITCACSDDALMSARVSFLGFPILVNMLMTGHVLWILIFENNLDTSMCLREITGGNRTFFSRFGWRKKINCFT